MSEKIVFVLDCLYADASGGTETQFLRLIETREALGIDANIVFLDHRDVHDRIEWPNTPLTLEISSFFRPSTLKALSQLESFVNEVGAETVHSFFDDAAILCWLFHIKRPDIRFICSQRSLGSERSAIKNLFMRFVYRSANRIAVNSSGIRDHLQLQFSVPTKKIFLVDNIIDRATTDCSVDSKIRADVEKLRGGKQTLILCVANLRHVKGIDDIIRAAALIGPHYDFRIVVFGEGPERKSYESIIAELGLKDRVVLAGYYAAAAEALAFADMALLASHFEGGSNSLIEYMLAGLPIVATDVGGNSDFIDHEQTGLLVPVANPGQLAAGIERLLGCPDFAHSLGRRARASAESRFAMDVVLAGHRFLYDDAQDGNQFR